MDNKPKMTKEYAIGCLEDLLRSTQPYSQDKDYRELIVALSMGIRAIRLTPLEDIYNINL